MSRVSSFLIGAAGGLLAVLLAALLIPAYTDYSSRAHAADLISSSEKARVAVEKRAVTIGTLTGSGLGVPGAVSTTSEMLVLEDGAIVLHSRTSDGQVIVLLPALTAGQVTWRCLGGSAKDVPARCRE